MSEQERIAAQRMGEGISATGPFGEPLPLDANSGMSLQQLKEALAGQPTTPVDPAQELQEAIEGLQIQKSQTSDPDEIKALDRMIEAAMVGASAPLGQMAAQIQAEGRGEDPSLA